MPPIFCVLLGAICAVCFPPQQEQQPRVRFGPGVCGPLDPAHVEIATETGGNLFPVAPDEISKLAPLMVIDATGDAQLLLRSSGEHDHTYSVPVDASAQRVWLFASFDGRGGTFTVMSPDGSVVRQGERIEDAVLNCGRILTIDAPAAGMWKLRVAPTARFWLVAKSKAGLSIEMAEFVDGPPVAGTAATVRVRLSSEVRSARVRLVSLDGEALESADLEYAPQDDQFTGAIKVPLQPFRLSVNGVDDRGAPFQRMDSEVFRPSSR